jgi:hypothetical protein
MKGKQKTKAGHSGLGKALMRDRFGTSNIGDMSTEAV